MRQNFAQCLRERGVEVAATYRSDRGVGRKGESQKIVNMRRRGVVPAIDKSTLNAAVDTLKGRAGQKQQPWLLALAQKNKHVRAEYTHAGQALLNSDKEDVKAIGRLLCHYAQEMPEPQTREQELMNSIASRANERRISNDRDMER